MADSAKLRHAPAAGHAGLCPAELAALREELDLLPASGWCSGAVSVAGRGPWIALEHATGWAVRYSSYDAESDAGVELPRERWEPMTPGTLFDLASLTKLFTAVAAMRQCERGAVGLDREVARYVPEFGARGKDRITVRQLLTHTSGLRPEIPFAGDFAGGFADEFADEFAGERDGRDLLAPLWDEEPVTAPGSTYCYSDLNLITLQQVLERVSGMGLDALIRDGITGPLGMDATSYGPVPAASAAATEDQRRPWAKADRGMLRGTVHDENAFALGGVAGHAGLFSTAADLAVLCRALLSGGSYGGARILTPSSVEAMLAPPGLGFAVGQPRFMGELAELAELAVGGGESRPPESELAGQGPAMHDEPAPWPGRRGRAAGHTGFTGTSLVLDPVTDTFLVLLANTVHPVRRPAGNGPRAAAATRLARAARNGAP